MAGTLRIMDSTGDTRLLWQNEQEAEAVANVFMERLRNGYSAFAGDKQIRTFDPSASDIVMISKIQGG